MSIASSCYLLSTGYYSANRIHNLAARLVERLPTAATASLGRAATLALSDLRPGLGSTGQSFFFVSHCWWLYQSNAAFELAEDCMQVSDSGRHWHELLNQH